MKAIIILEGPDGSGKTTLAKRLVEKYDAIHLHCRYRFKKNIYAYHLAVIRKARNLARRGKVVVIDRFWPSEDLYASVYRGGTARPQAGRLLDRIALASGAVYVFCGVGLPWEVLNERRAMASGRTPELYPDVEKFKKLVSRYHELWAGPLGGMSTTPSTYADVVTVDGGFCKRVDSFGYDGLVGLEQTCIAAVCTSNAFIEALPRGWFCEPTGGNPAFATHKLIGAPCNGIELATREVWDTADTLHALGLSEYRLCWSPSEELMRGYRARLGENNFAVPSRE